MVKYDEERLKAKIPPLLPHTQKRNKAKQLGVSFIYLARIHFHY